MAPDRGSVTSGAAFKTAVRTALVFAVVLIISGSLAFFYLHRQMMNTLEDQIAEDQILLAQIYSDSGQAGLVEAINALQHPLLVKLRAVGLFDPAGQRLAGNIDTPPGFVGWQRVSLRVAGAAPSHYYLNASHLDIFTLVVGRDVSLIEMQENRMIGALVLLGLTVSAAFLAIGYVTSLQALQKLERLAQTLDLVSQGDTRARLAVSGSNDQIDRIARAVNIHLDRLTSLMTTTKASAAAIAHDLRTPLSRAFLLVDRAMGQMEAGEDARGTVDEIEAELARLRSIFDAILRITRLEGAEDQTRFTTVPLGPLLAEMVETFGPIAEERGQSLILAPVPPTLAVLGDEAMLAQLLANLVQNALSHCPQGTVITLSARAGAQVVISVADTGPGIALAERERVFDLFYRIDPNRTGSGNGLGMALVRAIAERMGAEVTLSDTVPGAPSPGLRVDVVFAALPGNRHS